MAEVILTRRRKPRIEQGHPWIYQSEVAQINGDYEPGDVVDVYNHSRHFIGRAYINPRSQIMLRILTYEPQPIDREFFRQRIQRAWDYRRFSLRDTDACRVIFGEADFLPALIVDKYSDYLVIQTLALGIDGYKDIICDVLEEIIQPQGIYERNDAPVRKLEGLPQQAQVIRGTVPQEVVFRENGIKFYVDISGGQKTGYFLDQKENKRMLKPYVQGKRVLDCFSHTGSFAVHSAVYGAHSVTALDISEDAIGMAVRNAQLNGVEHICHFEAANVFDQLRRYDEQGEQFDLIILDPPAFTKSRQAISGALRGYKEINLRAMRLLPVGGYLATCSCSYHMDPQLFRDMIQDAAHDVRRRVRLVEWTTQAKDHPILLASKETQYLKFALLQVF